MNFAPAAVAVGFTRIDRVTALPAPLLSGPSTCIYLYANADPLMYRDPSGKGATLAEMGMVTLVVGTLAIIAIPQVFDMGIKAARTLIEAAVYGAEKTAEGVNQLYSLTLALEVMKANEKAKAKPVSLLLQDPAQGKAVIGETMSRVTAAAFRFSGETFAPISFLGSVLPSFPLQNQSDFNYWMWANRAWIRSVMVRELLIIDIGRDETKVWLGWKQSEFYSMELEETAPYFLKVYQAWPASLIAL